MTLPVPRVNYWIRRVESNGQRTFDTPSYPVRVCGGGLLYTALTSYQASKDTKTVIGQMVSSYRYHPSRQQVLGPERSVWNCTWSYFPKRYTQGEHFIRKAHRMASLQRLGLKFPKVGGATLQPRSLMPSLQVSQTIRRPLLRGSR